MAPKHAEMMENHPLVSSPEEDEESGSSGEESQSSGDDSKKDGSFEEEGDEDQSKPILSTAAHLAPKKLESDSEAESDSDSDPEPVKKQQTQNTVVIKLKAETSGSAVTLPGSSTPKRPLKQAEDEANKKMKTSTTEQVKKPATDEDVKKISGEEAKKMFQRLFSGTDEIALLQGILDFTGDISEDMDAFCDYVKKLINFDATKSQIVTKIRRLKKKFVNIVKKSLIKEKSEDQIKFSKDLDQKAFELSRKIWGSKGVLASKSRKKLGGTLKDTKLAHLPKKEIEKPNLVNTTREIALFFTENVGVFGLDESTISAGWDMVEDGAKKTEMEEKLKKLKAKQVELCLQRTALLDNAAKMIFKDTASSS